MRVLTIKYADLLLRKKAVREAMPFDWTMHVLFNTILNTIQVAKELRIPADVHHMPRLRSLLSELDGEIGSVCFLYRGADVSSFSPSIAYFEPVSPRLSVGDEIDGRRVYEARVRLVDVPLDLCEIYTSLLLRFRRGEWRVYYDESTSCTPDVAMAALESFFSKIKPRPL